MLGFKDVQHVSHSLMPKGVACLSSDSIDRYRPFHLSNFNFKNSGDGRLSPFVVSNSCSFKIDIFRGEEHLEQGPKETWQLSRKENTVH